MTSAARNKATPPKAFARSMEVRREDKERSTRSDMECTSKTARSGSRRPISERRARTMEPGSAVVLRAKVKPPAGLWEIGGEERATGAPEPVWLCETTDDATP